MLTKDKKILIVGLGLMGGSYAQALKREGVEVGAVTRSQESLDYALEQGILDAERGDYDADAPRAVFAEILCQMLREEDNMPAAQAEDLFQGFRENILETLHVNDLRMQEQSPLRQLLRSIQYMQDVGNVIPWGTALPDEADIAVFPICCKA